MDDSCTQNTAPSFCVRLRPSKRCWQCKQPMEAGGLRIECPPFFGSGAMCSFACARRYVLDAADVCQYERSAALVQITEAQLDEGQDPACPEGAPAQGWYHKAGRTMCWGCMQPLAERETTVRCVTQSDGGGLLGWFHNASCRMRFLRERLMEPSLRTRVQYWSGGKSARSALGCDWRLHADFGGPFEGCRLPNLPLSILMVKSDVALVLQHADTMPMRMFSGDSGPHSADEVVDWAKRCSVDLWVDKSGGVEPDSVETTSSDKSAKVRRILASMPPDNPIALWHEAHKDHPKAKDFVLFRDKDLPFRVNTAMSVRRASMSGDMMDDNTI